MRDLYPPLEPYRTGTLMVSSIHTIYFEECGNPQGQPVVFLHGGPGGGIQPKYRQFFDPSHYRIILFDQRGSGMSTPHACLDENTTWDLVADIEKLRQQLKVEKWMVFGGSWGSALALVYAETHPDRVTHLVLRGIFLMRQWELDWFYEPGGASELFPEYWEEFLKPIPAEEQHDMMKAYYRRLTSNEPQEQIAAAVAWSIWEGSTSKLLVDPHLVEKCSHEEFAVAFARIECHYFINRCFVEENFVLNNIHKVRHIPTVIVQGRYDLVCPARSAWELHQAFPESRLIITPTSGHSQFEPENLSALVEATDAFRT